MDTKQQAALKRLTKKLSALRQTLRKDERELLDTIVLGQRAEVKGHRLYGTTVGGATVGGATVGSRDKRTTKKGKGDAEVSGHAMFGSATTGPQNASVGSAVGSAATSAFGAATSTAIQASVTFDADSATYRVTDAASV